MGENLIFPEGNLKTINANGKLVIPGGIDTHTHLEFYFNGTRTADDFYTGTRAALAGGTTTVLNFIVEDRNMPLLDAYKLNRDRAVAKACCDFSFHTAVSRWDDKVEKELEVLVREKGINSVKMYMAYKDELMLKDQDMIKVKI